MLTSGGARFNEREKWQFNYKATWNLCFIRKVNKALQEIRDTEMTTRDGTGKDLE